MQIKELQPKQGNITIELDIIKKNEPKVFQKFGKEGKVCNAEGKDESGTVKISLWNEQADLVNVGDRVRIENGYASEWQGEIQLTTGKFGKIEVIGKADSISEE
jgi:replication factor A1